MASAMVGNARGRTAESPKVRGRARCTPPRPTPPWRRQVQRAWGGTQLHRASRGQGTSWPGRDASALPCPWLRGRGSPPCNVPVLRPCWVPLQPGQASAVPGVPAWPPDRARSCGRSSHGGLSSRTAAPCSIQIRRRPGEVAQQMGQCTPGPGWRRTGGVARTWRALPGLDAAAAQRQGDSHGWRSQERVSLVWGMGELARARTAGGERCAGTWGEGRKLGTLGWGAFDGSWTAPEVGGTGWASLLQASGQWSIRGAWGGGG